MELFEKLKETAVSVLPIYIIVILSHFFLTPFSTDLLVLFSLSTLLLMLGLTLFNLGVDKSIEKMGNIVGNAVLEKNSVVFAVALSFLIGFMVTFAEPDLQVLGNQLATITGGQIGSFLLVAVVSIGTGLFVVIAMLRIIMNFKLKTVILLSYGLLFILASIAQIIQPELIPVGFDSGGVTTGPLTVPFIMALGIGVASRRASKSNQDDSFGVVGLASVGPIITTILLSLIKNNVSVDPASLNEVTSTYTGLGIVMSVLIHEIKNVFIALAPLVTIFMILNFTTLKIKTKDLMEIIKGLVLNYIGVVLFLTGVNAGFTTLASQLGSQLITLDHSWIIILFGFILGLVIVFAEPAIWVLNRNIEEVSGGYISSKLMLGSLSISVGLAVSLAMLRIYVGFSLLWYIIPGYLIALGLMKYAPTIFTGIAFDSGGVSTGPMTATFILSMAIGAAIANGSNVLLEAFGLVAVVAMIPLIVIQLLGIVYASKTKQRKTTPSWVEED